MRLECGIIALSPVTSWTNRHAGAAVQEQLRLEMEGPGSGLKPAISARNTGDTEGKSKSVVVSDKAGVVETIRRGSDDD